MRTTIGEVKRVVREVRVAASASYAKKERVRERLQQVIQDAVADGTVTDDASLADLFKTFDMATSALKMVPFDVWLKMSVPKTKR